MKIFRPHERLGTLWGKIDRDHNSEIARHLLGERILDIGCGFGSLIAFLNERCYTAVGVDPDPQIITLARELFPFGRFVLDRAEALSSVETASVDTVVFRDSFHHVYGEGNMQACMQSILRVLAPRGRIVVFDPNVTYLVKFARLLIGHRDVVAKRSACREVLIESGFQIREETFFEVFGLALSGGYVGPRLIPRSETFERIIAYGNRLASRAAVRCGLGPTICWRYLIAADRI